MWPLSSAAAVEKLAYTQVHDGFWQVWEMDMGGGKARLLTDTPVDKSYPEWSDDGKRLAFVTSMGELWIMDMADGKAAKVPLRIPAFQPKFSKDGGRILFISPRDVFHDDIDIWCVGVDGKNLTLVTKQPWAQVDPAWMSQDEVLYVDAPKLAGDEICKVNMKNGDVVRLTTNKSNDIQPVYLPGGEGIVYASNENGTFNIRIMDKYGRNPRDLSNDQNHNVMPAVSRGGATVYFLSDRTGALEIFSLDLKTGESRQVTSDGADKKDFAVYAD